MKKNKKICIILLAITLLAVWFFHNYVYVSTKYRGNINKFGIIDDGLTINSSDKIIYKGSLLDTRKKTHGDLLLDYIEKKGYNGKIYFFSALGKNGKISSDSIIMGLEWLKKNNIKIVNISLSSKQKSKKLQDWIDNNKDVQIYCSYNNKDNTFDYPAMLSGVIGSGANRHIDYKDNDCKYSSNRIVLFNKGVYFFNGNSYLSIETLLHQ